MTDEKRVGITQQLRAMAAEHPQEHLVMFDPEEFDDLCSAIDTVHANLEAELERVQGDASAAKELSETLSRINAIAGPYRNLQNNYESLRASRDRWKAIAERNERRLRELEADAELVDAQEAKEGKERLESVLEQIRDVASMALGGE